MVLIGIATNLPDIDFQEVDRAGKLDGRKPRKSMTKWKEKRGRGFREKRRM